MAILPLQECIISLIGLILMVWCHNREVVLVVVGGEGGGGVAESSSACKYLRLCISQLCSAVAAFTNNEYLVELLQEPH